MTIRHSLAAALAVASCRAMTCQSATAPFLLRGMQVAYGPDDDRGQKSAAELAAEIKADHAKATDAVKAIAEEALGKAKASETLTENLKAKADEALTKMNALTEQIAELEQKQARHGPEHGDAQKSFGQQFVDTDQFKSLSEAPRAGAAANLHIKADITTATTDAAGSAGAGIVPNRLPGIQGLPRMRLTIRALLSPGRTDGPLVQYLQETGFNNNAAPVAEGGLKPQSDLKLTDKDISTKVIAHWFRASKQILSDFSQVRSMIDERLLYGLALKEEQQLLNGDGTGENLHGIMPQASEFAIPAGFVAPAPMTAIDTLRIAMLQAALAEFPATGHVLNPIDWAGIETLKDGIGRYVIGDPQGEAQPTLWRLPVVDTQAMAVGKFLTGAFRLGAQIFDQWDSRIEVGFQNDDFVRNKVTILAEERLALAVYRPEAFVTGDINPPAPPPGGGD